MFGKSKSDCTHPAANLIWLREDKTDRYKTTGARCSICGAHLPAPKPMAEKLAPQG